MPNSNLLGVNINYPSSYSALAVSAILTHYGHSDIPIGLRGPITNETFFDDYFYELGEFTSKVTYHWSNDSIPWNKLHDIWNPVSLYRKLLASQKDNSVTIASIGFFENLSGLLNSTADEYSHLSGRDLITKKVSQLVVMGGRYPSGSEYNFFGDDPLATAHVINTWPSQVPIVFSGGEIGENVQSGGLLARDAPEDDPVRAAYRWYVGYNQTRSSWDPLTVLYAVQGLGDVFEYGNTRGYNHVFANGSNEWVFDGKRRDQKWLRLKVDNVTAAARLDQLFLEGANIKSPRA
ncbi:uncharacterized protein RCO7_10163 [Rhynchosporium graminicola]|uniref:Uncharacterized protein n=1 Tax=Rhynchosporium graminicola TaxID=2792576 RepID=A0A1E1LKP7_9HELO|nr:uncharacterized protein RCO7_10163 [Rhynchosporium commune]